MVLLDFGGFLLSVVRVFE